MAVNVLKYVCNNLSSSFMRHKHEPQCIVFFNGFRVNRYFGDANLIVGEADYCSHYPISA